MVKRAAENLATELNHGISTHVTAEPWIADRFRGKPITHLVELGSVVNYGHGIGVIVEVKSKDKHPQINPLPIQQIKNNDTTVFVPGAAPRENFIQGIGGGHMESTKILQLNYSVIDVNTGELLENLLRSQLDLVKTTSPMIATRQHFEVFPFH